MLGFAALGEVALAEQPSTDAAVAVALPAGGGKRHPILREEEFVWVPPRRKLPPRRKPHPVTAVEPLPLVAKEPLTAVEPTPPAQTPPTEKPVSALWSSSALIPPAPTTIRFRSVSNDELLNRLTAALQGLRQTKAAAPPESTAVPSPGRGVEINVAAILSELSRRRGTEVDVPQLLVTLRKRPPGREVDVSSLLKNLPRPKRPH